MFPFFSEVLSCCWTVWLSPFMVIEMFDWFWQIPYCTLDIHIRAYPPFLGEIFVYAVVWGWMISVGYLLHDFDIISYTGAYSPTFFEYPQDWDSGQLDFRLSTSLELPMIDCIKTSLYGFVEIEIDHIKFHPRSMGRPFTQMFMR